MSKWVIRAALWRNGGEIRWINQQLCLAGEHRHSRTAARFCLLFTNMSRCRNESRADCEKQIRPVCLVRVHSANNQPNTYALFHQPALYSQLLPFTAAAWYNTTLVTQGFYALLKGTWTIASKGVQFFSSSMMFQSQKATHTWKNVGWVSWN